MEYVGENESLASLTAAGSARVETASEDTSRASDERRVLMKSLTWGVTSFSTDSRENWLRGGAKQWMLCVESRRMSAVTDFIVGLE